MRDPSVLEQRTHNIGVHAVNYILPAVKDPGRLRLTQETILNSFPSSQSGERKKHFLLNLKVSGACSSLVFPQGEQALLQGAGVSSSLILQASPGLHSIAVYFLHRPITQTWLLCKAASGLGATVSGEHQKVNRGKKVGTDRSTEETNQRSPWVFAEGQKRGSSL